MTLKRAGIFWWVFIQQILNKYKYCWNMMSGVNLTWKLTIVKLWVSSLLFLPFSLYLVKSSWGWGTSLLDITKYFHCIIWNIVNWNFLGLWNSKSIYKASSDWTIFFTVKMLCVWDSQIRSCVFKFASYICVHKSINLKFNVLVTYFIWAERLMVVKFKLNCPPRIYI